jgi:ABC-2 type transport system ATP-binding protein
MPEIGEVRELQSDEADAPADDAPIRVRVSSRDRGDLREALFYRMAERGYPILEMRRESLSLEDVFLKLTTDEPAAQADSGEQDQAAADAAKADSTNEEGEGRA